MPQGVITCRWDDRLGVVLEAKYPDDIVAGLNDDDLLTIFSTHAMTESAGILSMRIKRFSIVSYYTGIPEDEAESQFFVALVLSDNENPNTYEESLTEIAKMIIDSIGKPGFEDFYIECFDRVSKMKEISEEQRNLEKDRLAKAEEMYKNIKIESMGKNLSRTYEKFDGVRTLLTKMHDLGILFHASILPMEQLPELWAMCQVWYVNEDDKSDEIDRLQFSQKEEIHEKVAGTSFLADMSYNLRDKRVYLMASTSKKEPNKMVKFLSSYIYLPINLIDIS